MMILAKDGLYTAETQQGFTLMILTVCARSSVLRMTLIRDRTGRNATLAIYPNMGYSA
jgi:hypothetical protein